MTIKHIVLSGGGYNGLYMLGCIDKLLEEEFIDISNVKTIYGTSFGALCGFMLCLKMKWKDIIEYFIERPWNKDINIKLDLLIDMVSKKGLLDEKIIANLLKKLILSCGLEIDLTFKDLYEYNNIELHTFHVEVNKFELVDCSYKTHGDMKILDAIYSSCSLPFLFKPGKINGVLMADGGLICAFPLNKCLESEQCENEEEVIGIEIRHSDNEKPINDESNLMDYGIFLFLKLIRAVNNKQKVIENYIPLSCEMLNIKTLLTLVKDKNKRKKFINNGSEMAEKFLKSSVDKFF
jgi:predicted acylesterase/phospholipase RssA|uniref:PNPLA domain-containing protein n=1 Tax=viral metagenome TaxID=1070528 RepID=A0A6C0BYN2_9ZZZZ